MRIEIIEVENKKNKIKIIVIFVITLLFIAIFSMLGIWCANKYQTNYIAKNKKSSKNSNRIENVIIEKTEISKEDNKDKIDKEIEISNKNEVNKIEPKVPIRNIYNAETKIAYLTFDDGPSQVVTPLILDVLKEENIKATFFVLGSNVKRNPTILKRAYEEGHFIANHGYSHEYKKIYKKASNVLEEYNKTEKIIREAICDNEYSSNLFRFPGGYLGGKYENIKKEAGKLLNKNNISYIDWNVLTGDAEGANTKEKILKNIEKHTKDKGSIVVLMHDASSKILTYETLKDVIQYLRNEGYTFENFYSIIH